jgi:thiamine-phosphate pyrophosphorylase
VTDRRRLAGDADWARARQCLIAQARHAIEAGVDVIQIRERDLEAAQLARLVAEVVVMARGTSCRVVVNDRFDVALACGAAGVHLRADSLPPSAVRSVVPRGFLIGRSVHAPGEAELAAPDVDYLIAGTVWSSESKPGLAGSSLLGARGLAEVALRVSVPVLAIGGVTLQRVADVAKSGAAGVAAVGLFMGPAGPSEDSPCRAVSVVEVVREARRRFDTPERAS